jgi:potassium-transporting ATPase ATP-binding subunit
MTTLTPPRAASAFSARQLLAALPGALRKLDPRQMWRNPVMFLVEVGALLTTAIAIAEPFAGGSLAPGFSAGIAVWLWVTVVFANLA